MKEEFKIKQRFENDEMEFLHPNADMHAEAEQTIEEHKRVMRQWDKVFHLEATGIRNPEKDLYTEVEETIKEHKRVMQQWKHLFGQEENKYVTMPGKIAA